jgi:hypothetical protein
LSKKTSNKIDRKTSPKKVGEIKEINQSIFNQIKSSKSSRPIVTVSHFQKENGKFRIFFKKNQILHYAISVKEKLKKEQKLEQKQKQKRKTGEGKRARQSKT